MLTNIPDIIEGMDSRLAEGDPNEDWKWGQIEIQLEDCREFFERLSQPSRRPDKGKFGIQSDTGSRVARGVLPKLFEMIAASRRKDFQELSNVWSEAKAMLQQE